MANRGYGTVREYRDDPSLIYSDNPTPNRGAFNQVSEDFTSLCNELSSNIFQINNNSSSLERLLNDVGTQRDSANLREKMHNVEQKTNKLVTAAAQMFKKFSRQKYPERQAMLQIEKIKSDFEETVQRYNRLQKLAASRVKTSGPVNQNKFGTVIDLETNETSDSSQLLVEEERRAYLQTQTDTIDTEVGLIEEREEQIRQLESDILNVNEIFRDLATLVYEQGDLVDSIEANVEKAYDNVETGNQQLSQASRYAVKYRKKLCICAVIVGVIAAIIVTIVVVNTKTGY